MPEEWLGVSRADRGQGQRREQDTQEIEKGFLKVSEGSHYGAWKRQGGM